MEQDIKTATEEEHREPKNPHKTAKKNLSFGKALLTTLPMNENIIVCSESPQFFFWFCSLGCCWLFSFSSN